MFFGTTPNPTGIAGGLFILNPRGGTVRNCNSANAIWVDRNKDIRLHFRSDFPELQMDYDPEKLQNVLSNLLSNAIKFTPAGWDVYVDLRLEKPLGDSIHGADAYLAKPFHQEELLVRMEKLIELRRRLQERFQKAGSLHLVLHARAQSVEDLFLQKVIRVIESQMSDENFGMPQLCKVLHMDRTNLFRKLKALTGKSATVFIRSLRLEKAKELLETTDLSVSEVCYKVGFNNPNYFSTAFHEEFGMPPSGVRK